MSKPESFILNSDYATLKNDGTGTDSVVVPSSISIPGNGSQEYHTDITIGSNASIVNVRISSSKDSSNQWRSNNVKYDYTGTNSGSPATYSVYAFVYRTSPTNLRLQAYIPNPYSSTTTGASGDETITFYVKTFVAPYA